MDYEIYAIKRGGIKTMSCDAGWLRLRLKMLIALGYDVITVYSHITHKTYKLA